MGLGRRETTQPGMWVATHELPRSPGHVFYEKLNRLQDSGDVPPADIGAASEQTADRSEPDARGSSAFVGGWDAGFAAGWDAGFLAAAAEQPACTAEPEVVVLQSSPSVQVNVPRYDPSGVYYESPYIGSVTVPFDDGASRGLTLRERIQEQRMRLELALAREMKPEVVLCDIGLPDIDGYEVVRQLCADEELSATRLVALTGYAQSDDKQRIEQAGFHAHLAKPATLDDLNEILARQ